MKIKGRTKDGAVDVEAAWRARVGEDAVRILGEVSSGLVHDVANDLHALGLRLSVLREDPALPPGQGDNVAAIGRILDEALASLRRVQAFVRPVDGGADGAVDLAAIVDEALALARGAIDDAAARAGVEIRIEREAFGRPAIRGRAPELRQALLHLLLDARDALPAGGAIRVAGRSDGARVVLEVSDEGSATFDEGARRGLDVARALTLRAGGTFRATGRDAGGAVLSLAFPLLAVERHASASEASAAPRSARQSPRGA